MGSINRRDFIKIASATFAGMAVSSGLVSDWWGLDAPLVANPLTDGDRVVPTFCELCF